MRKFKLMILGVLVITGLNAQTIDKLDTKNGFKDFTLGDPCTKWQDQLKYEGSWNDGTKAYLYTGSCCKKVFNYPIDKIVLRFSAKKLVGIYIITEKFQKAYAESGVYTTWRSDDFESIKSSLSYLFGKPTSLYARENSDSGVTYLWVGEKVLLTSKYEFLGTLHGDRQLINILDLQFLNKEIEKGF